MNSEGDSKSRAIEIFSRSRLPIASKVLESRENSLLQKTCNEGISIARDLLSPSLFTQLIVIHSLDLSAQLIVCSIATTNRTA